MKKIVFLLFAINLLLIHPAYTQEVAEYDKIYESSPILDFYYEQNEDPDEITDHQEHIRSPYPLIRTSSPLSTKSSKIIPGYYLLTPRNKDGYDFVMFKQKGRITALVPVFEKKLINPLEVYPQPIKRKVPLVKKPFAAMQNGLKFVFKPYIKPPELPKYLLNSDYVAGGKYFEIHLYKDEYLYKMLFKVDR